MNKEQIQIAKKTLKILSNKSWGLISIKDISRVSKLPKNIKNKNDLLKNINRYFDYLIKINTRTLEVSSKKDMLFEVIMARFDILQKYRKSIIKIYESFRPNPHKSLLLIPSFLESMMLSADIAKFDTKGIKGTIKLKGLFIIYVATFFIWMNDKTKSLEKTMTALDKYLDQSGKFMNKIV